MLPPALPLTPTQTGTRSVSPALTAAAAREISNTVTCVLMMPSGPLAVVTTLLPELLLRGPAVGMDKPPATWPPASPLPGAINEVKVSHWTPMEETYIVPAAFTPAQISFPSMPSPAQLVCDALVPAPSKPLVSSQVMTSGGDCGAVMAVHWAAPEAAPSINIPSMVQVHAVIESTGVVDTSSPAVPTQLTTIRWVISCTMAVAVMPNGTSPTYLQGADSPVPMAAVVATQALVAVTLADFRRTRAVAHILRVESSGVWRTGFWGGVVVKPVSGTPSLGCGAGLDASLAGSLAFSDVLSLTIAGRLSTSRSALLSCILHVCALASRLLETRHEYQCRRMLRLDCCPCLCFHAQSCPLHLHTFFKYWETLFLCTLRQT